MRRKALFVSYGHENLKVASSVQSHRLTSALRRFYDIDILYRSSSKNDNGVKVASPDLFLIDRILLKIFPFLGSVFSVDRMIWSLKAFMAVKKDLKKYSFIIIPYEPYTTRLFQMLCRKNCDTKIVTVLYDPYYDNIFFSQSKIGKKLRKGIENKIVSNSDCVVVNNNRMYETFCKRYIGKSIYMIPLCGKEDITLTANSTNDKLNIVFAGNIFGERKIDSLNYTISLLKKQIENLSQKMEISIYGNVFVGFDKIKEDGNDDVIIYRGFIPASEVDFVLSRADALLLLDPLNKDNYSYPSKLCEYFQYKKVIIAFSGEGTPSFCALKETNNIVHKEGEEQKMADEIRQLIISGCHNRTPDNYLLQFYPDNIAKRYKEIIDGI